MKILVANPGSTSLKYKLFALDSADANPRTLARGKIERIGSGHSPFVFISVEGAGETAGRERRLEGVLDGADYRAALGAVIEHLLSPGGGVLERLDALDAVGFKAVHAGPLGRGPGATWLNDAVLDAMQRYSPLAPAHNPPYLSVIRLFRELTPTVRLAALFEPAFHATIPEERVTYGLPSAWREGLGIRRYGFHGASHRYIADRMTDLLDLPIEARPNFRLISCHLGGSSSLCAIRGGVSVDTTMGFSPQTGILHSTRCETIDPFAVLFAQRELGLSADEVSRVLCEESGLKGLSGGSGDFRDLWAQAEGADVEKARRGRLALAVFFYQVRREIAAMAATLEGVDAVCFTGGIGENGVRERAAICAGLGWLGIALDAEANQRAVGIEARISAATSRVEVWTCPTNEEWIVAREVCRLLSAAEGQ